MADHADPTGLDAWRDVAILHWQNLPPDPPREWCLEDLDDGDRSDDCGV